MHTYIYTHTCVYLHEPLLDVPLLLAQGDVHGLVQLHHLALHGDHGLDDAVRLVEADLVDALEALAHVRLHRRGVLYI